MQQTSHTRRGGYLTWQRSIRRTLFALLAGMILLLASACGEQPTGQQPSDPTPTTRSGTDSTGNLPPASFVRLPPGFRVTIFAEGLKNPRFLTFSPNGTLLVAERGARRIVALPDPNHTGQASGQVTVADGLNAPSSLAFAPDGSLYVGETSRVSRFSLGPDLRATSSQKIVDLPTGGNHTTRTVLIGPDGRLYVSIGSTCNNCLEADPQRATVWVYQANGSNGRLYARGLRNAVGMAINPWNQQIWVTNNGRDNLGDNTPPETVYALRDGGNYGWPYCHAGTIIDPDFGSPDSCNGIVQPLVKMQAHSAPLGLAFYNAGPFPQQYHGLFVAFHGSWNRSVPTGYKVVFIPLDANGQVAGQLQDFATGWLTGDGKVLGRPVGLAVGPDGALYLSDDQGGIIYRISYAGS